MKLLSCSLILGILALSGFVTIGCGDDDDDNDSGGIDDDDSTDDDTNDEANDDVDDDDTVDVFLPPDELGPYKVGVFSFFFSYDAGSRILPTMVWYPTEDTTGEPMTYLLGLIPDRVAFRDATITQDGPFPLIVFSHGSQSVNFQSFSFIDHLVSHGYIVAACGHIQSTALTYFTPTYFAKSAIDRPQDISALIDAMLAESEDGASRFHGKVDADRIGIFGHSFGGYTSIAALGAPVDLYGMVEKCEEIGESNWHGEWHRCEDLANSDMSYADHCDPCNLGDPRIKVSVPMAPSFPYMIQSGGLENIDVPVLIMAGELDEITPPLTQNRLFFDGLSHPETLYWELKGGSHYTFSSVCELPITGLFFTCDQDHIGAGQASPLIKTALTAFLGLHLLGDERYRYYFQDDYLATTPEILLETKSVSDDARP
jgi:predicted dienelactone hydrolase